MPEQPVRANQSEKKRPSLRKELKDAKRMLFNKEVKQILSDDRGTSLKARGEHLHAVDEAERRNAQRSLRKKIFSQDKLRGVDVLQEQAQAEDRARTQERREKLGKVIDGLDLGLSQKARGFVIDWMLRPDRESVGKQLLIDHLRVLFYQNSSVARAWNEIVAEMRRKANAN